MNRQARLENLSAYIDGELTADEQRLLAAWCDHHPEDVDEFEALAATVALCRELPLVDPPAGLREAILRAVANLDQVEASREQAIDWLDDYLDGELSEPKRRVVEHYLAVDAEFAELAELHQAMLTAVAGLGEVEPPAGLKEQIAASLERSATPATRPVRRARRRVRRGALPWIAAAAVLGLILAHRSRQPAGPVVAVNPPAETQPVAEPVTPPVAPAADTPVEVPGVPVDDAAEPLVPDTPAPAPATRTAPVRSTPTGGEAIATNQREPRTPAPATDLPRATTPAPTPRGRKPAPPLSPAPMGSSGATERLAAPGGESTATTPAEFVTGSGQGSVLGNEKDGSRGNPEEGTASQGSRGSVDPTRRGSEVPPF